MQGSVITFTSSVYKWTLDKPNLTTTWYMDPFEATDDSYSWYLPKIYHMWSYNPHWMVNFMVHILQISHHLYSSFLFAVLPILITYIDRTSMYCISEYLIVFEMDEAELVGPTAFCTLTGLWFLNFCLQFEGASMLYCYRQ